MKKKRVTLKPAVREALVLDVLKKGSMPPGQIGEHLPEMSMTTIRKTICGLRMAGLVERTGASCNIEYQLSAKAGTPDECNDKPFEHRHLPAGKWQYKPHARAVASVWQLGAQ